jgi:hypothetical protein
MFIICTTDPVPFYWTGDHWAHSVSHARRYPSAAEAEVARWNEAGTDSVIGEIKP